MDSLTKEAPLLSEEVKEETPKLKQPRSGAESIALDLGIITRDSVIGLVKAFNGKKLVPVRGLKALVGQYVTDGVDQSERINARLGDSETKRDLFGEKPQ